MSGSILDYKWVKYGDISVDMGVCHQSHPCKHYVKYEDGSVGLMNGMEICIRLRQNGKYNPHFDKYAGQACCQLFWCWFRY